MIAVVVVEKKKFSSVVLNSYLNCTAVLDLLCSVWASPNMLCGASGFVLCTVYLSLLVLNELIGLGDTSFRNSFSLNTMKLPKCLCLHVCEVYLHIK